MSLLVEGPMPHHIPLDGGGGGQKKGQRLYFHFLGEGRFSLPPGKKEGKKKERGGRYGGIICGCFSKHPRPRGVQVNQGGGKKKRGPGFLFPSKGKPSPRRWGKREKKKKGKQHPEPVPSYAGAQRCSRHKKKKKERSHRAPFVCVRGGLVPERGKKRRRGRRLAWSNGLGRKKKKREEKEGLFVPQEGDKALLSRAGPKEKERKKKKAKYLVLFP